MKQIEVAIGIVRQENRVLICQRLNKGEFAGYWEFPGGKIEHGETPEQCVVREITEEVGILVKPFDSFPIIGHTDGDVAVRIYPYLCDLIEGNARPLASQQLLWVAAEKLAEYRFPPANDNLIGQIIARLATKSPQLSVTPPL